MTTSRPMLNRSRQSGFTLIEVMVVVAIIAILSAIAIPSYRDYVLRGRLVDATNLLATFRGHMERYYQDNRTYLATGGFNPPCAAAIPVAQRTQGDSLNYFIVTCSAGPTASTYTLQATGYGTVAGFAYTVTESDVKQTVSLGAGWPMPATNTCWVVKKGQAC
jgi:type IV pilus assembly protein PilE